MTLAASSPTASLHLPVLAKPAVWTGRVASALPSLFMFVDAVGKLAMLPEVAEGTQKLGWPLDVMRTVGIVQLVSVLLYLFPRTAVLGAILLTGYLGGAVATHVRVHDPLFSHTLFPTYLGALLWLGLWLRDARLRALLPLRG